MVMGGSRSARGRPGNGSPVTTTARPALSAKSQQSFDIESKKTMPHPWLFHDVISGPFQKFEKRVRALDTAKFGGKNGQEFDL